MKTNSREQMTIEQAIEVLSHHNRWRRGDDEAINHPVKMIGEAIDFAIAALFQLPRAAQPTEEWNAAIEAAIKHFDARHRELWSPQIIEELQSLKRQPSEVSEHTEEHPLAKQVAEAKYKMKQWSDEKRESVQLEGGDKVSPQPEDSSEKDKVDAKELLTAALNVVAWDWSNNDSDCVRDMEKLRNVAERIEAIADQPEDKPVFYMDKDNFKCAMDQSPEGALRYITRNPRPDDIALYTSPQSSKSQEGRDQVLEEAAHK